MALFETYTSGLSAPASILAPVTPELLGGLVPGIGDITFPGYTERAVK